jgi:hypothetical protein
MTKIIKHEWHTVDSQYSFDLTIEKLKEIYPDKSDEELNELLSDIMFNIDQVIEDALDNGIDIEWEPEYDDWVTDRKGGYEITYDIVDEDS